ncbi:hypothetical protein [Akkermansia sp.]|uniref:hypothetical protein n=1 Tax=Akkermansia sp. TaxID=1872421 RepID=UPI0025C5EAB6|nr:hypothetical protein [Akkermansia sp.]MCD8063384.1 hypothetical protein [Akkermansia sp.]
MEEMNPYLNSTPSAYPWSCFWFNAPVELIFPFSIFISCRELPLFTEIALFIAFSIFMKFHLKYRLFEIQPLLDELSTDDTCLYSILLKISKFHRTLPLQTASLKDRPNYALPRDGRTTGKACPLSPGNLKDKDRLFIKIKNRKRGSYKIIWWFPPFYG